VRRRCVTVQYMSLYKVCHYLARQGHADVGQMCTLFPSAHLALSLTACAWHVIRFANAHKFITEFPEGYATRVGRGVCGYPEDSGRYAAC